MTTALSLDLNREWTVGELAGLPPELNYELINGRLVVTSAKGIHQVLCRAVANALDENCPHGYMVACDLSLEIDPRNEPRPDVVVTLAEHCNVSPVPCTGALLAVEVISDSSVTRDTREKVEIYARAGIFTYWILDQRGPRIELTERLLDPGRGCYVVERRTTGLFTASWPWPITLDLPALSARRATLLEQVKGLVS